MAIDRKSPLNNPTGYDTYGLLGGTNVYTKYDKPNNKPSTSNEQTVVGPQPYPTLQPYTSSGGSGGYNLSGIIDAYNQGAQANRDIEKYKYDTTIQNLNTILSRARDSYNIGVSNANRTYDTTANRLEKALARFQAENAKNVANQKRSYLAEQAALEDARFQADRQTRIDAASRGLGGSGLQQLAQLQNLISQGNDISELAISNQGVMDDLRTALANYTEDYNDDLKDAQTLRDTTLSNLLTTLGYAESDYATNSQNALTAYNNAIKQINADLATNIAGAKSSYASSSAANNTIGSYLTNSQKVVDNQLKELSGASKSDLRDIAKNLGFKNPGSVTKSQIANAIVENALTSVTPSPNDSIGINNYNTFSSNLDSILKYYGY